jgi:hypothetical protein
LHRCHQKPKGVAKVAAARKLAVRLYWMLRSQVGYPEIVRIERRLLIFPSVFDPQTKAYRVRIEPSFLSNQAFRAFCEGWGSLTRATNCRIHP